jgi:hypothetical protein
MSAAAFMQRSLDGTRISADVARVQFQHDHIPHCGIEITAHWDAPRVTGIKL